MSMFHWKREERLAAVNRYTVESVLEYVKTLRSDKPTYVTTPGGGSMLTPTHFNNWAVANVCEELTSVLKANIPTSPSRITRSAIDTIIEQLGIHAQHISQETDSTLFARNYSMGIDRIQRNVKRHFIRRPRCPNLVQ